MMPLGYFQEIKHIRIPYDIIRSGYLLPRAGLIAECLLYPWMRLTGGIMRDTPVFQKLSCSEIPNNHFL